MKNEFYEKLTPKDIDKQLQLLMRGIQCPESISSEEVDEFIANLEAAHETNFLDRKTYKRLKNYFKNKRFDFKN